MNINAHWIYKQQKNAWDKNAWKNEKTVIWTQENSRKKPYKEKIIPPVNDDSLSPRSLNNKKKKVTATYSKIFFKKLSMNVN